MRIHSGLATHTLLADLLSKISVEQLHAARNASLLCCEPRSSIANGDTSTLDELCMGGSAEDATSDGEDAITHSRRKAEALPRRLQDGAQVVHDRDFC